jgi:hypothetical protein
VEENKEMRYIDMKEKVNKNWERGRKIGGYRDIS